MHARALICDEWKNFTLPDVVLNGPAPDQVAIRTHFAGRNVEANALTVAGLL